MRRSSIALVPVVLMLACSESPYATGEHAPNDAPDSAPAPSDATDSATAPSDAADSAPAPGDTADSAPAPDAETAASDAPLQRDGNATADAVSAVPPKRVVFFVSTLGIYHKQFRMSFPGTDADAGFEKSLLAESDSLSPILQPFKLLVPNLVVVDGLTQHASLNPWVRSTNGLGIDELARMSVLTGVAPISDSTTVHPTVAQLISDAIAPGHPMSPLVFSKSLSSTLTLPRIHSPWNARLALQRMEGLSQSTRDCLAASPELPMRDDNMDQWTPASLQLMSTSLRCGATSVAVLDVLETYAGAPGNLHQDCGDALTETNDSCFTAFNGATAKMVADFAQGLKSIPEGAGTMLDTTLVVWISTEGGPTHRPYPWNAVLVGGQSLGLRGGRYLRVPQNVPTEDAFGPITAVPRGASHNHLLVSIARLMGLPIDRVGDAVFKQRRFGPIDATGPLPGL